MIKRRFPSKRIRLERMAYKEVFSRRLKTKLITLNPFNLPVVPHVGRFK